MTAKRRCRFDAHELYLFSVVFDVPIGYFLLSPPGRMGTALADTGVPAMRLYAAIFGDDVQLEAVDERLERWASTSPRTLTPIMATVLGANPAPMNRPLRRFPAPPS